MARILLLDQSFPFYGRDLHRRPLGGVQAATILLAEALATRRHRVTVAVDQTESADVSGVSYRPLAQSGSEAADLVIANRVPVLFDRLGPGARTAAKALWLHGPARYLRKPRHWWPLLRHRPVPVFLGPYHAGTRPALLALRAGPVIPHGVDPAFLTAPVATAPPPPRAVFASNPRRGLDWLCDLWVRQIRPRVPAAELHVFAGRATYGDQPDDKLEAALAVAAGLADRGIILRAPVAHPALAAEWRAARVMLYRGDLGETFCFAAAEAQAMGVPLVTAGVGALAERLVDGETGYLRPEPDGFSAAAVRLLTDDGLWLCQHDAALARRADGSWDRQAASWEACFGL